MNTTNYELNPWDIGTLNKQAIWSYYSFGNYIGTVLCVILIISFMRHQNKSPGEILIGGLLSGCALMSVTCASQCFLNLISGTNSFQYGEWACKLEAFFHVSSIMVQFFCVALIAWRNHRIVAHSKDISPKTAFGMVAGVWFISEVGTFSLGLISPIYLMPTGAYCFYQFSSPVMLYWFCPVMVIALLFVCFFYYQIFTIASKIDVNHNASSSSLREKIVFAPSVIGEATSIASTVSNESKESVENKESDANENKPKKETVVSFPVLKKMSTKEQLDKISSNKGVTMSRKVAKSSIIFVLVFFFGWFPAVITTVYELFYGHIEQGLDTSVGIMGTLHSTLVPLAYGYHSSKLRKFLAKCQCIRKYFFPKYKIEKVDDHLTIVTKYKYDGSNIETIDCSHLSNKDGSTCREMLSPESRVSEIKIVQEEVIKFTSTPQVQNNP